MSTNDKWIDHIIDRGSLLAKWREKQREMKRLAEQLIYIRVGGEKFRAISVHPNNPYGRLIRKENGKDIGGTKSLDTAFENASEAAPADTAGLKPADATGSKEYKWVSKPEHAVQAGLIHHALGHDMLLNDRFKGFAEFFDELIFITDEMKAGDIRADIIALGGKGGRYFPVFIELKAIRSFERVVEQLKNAQERMDEARKPFIDMLVKATGKAECSIAFHEHKLLVAWPETRSGSEKASASAAVSRTGYELVKGHLLIGQFKRTVNPQDGFNSVIQFCSNA